MDIIIYNKKKAYKIIQKFDKQFHDSKNMYCSHQLFNHILDAINEKFDNTYFYTIIYLYYKYRYKFNFCIIDNKLYTDNISMKKYPNIFTDTINNFLSIIQKLNIYNIEESRNYYEVLKILDIFVHNIRNMKLTNIIDILNYSTNTFYKTYIINTILNPIIQRYIYNINGSYLKAPKADKLLAKKCKKSKLYYFDYLNLYFNNILTFNLDFIPDNLLYIDYKLIDKYLINKSINYTKKSLNFNTIYIDTNINKKRSFLDFYEYIKNNKTISYKDYFINYKLLNNILVYHKRKIFILLILF